MSQLHFLKRVSRHPLPRRTAPEVTHTFADDQAERRRDDSSMKIAAIVFYCAVVFAWGASMIVGYFIATTYSSYGH